MAKEQDRHTGRRENVWFPWDEHEAMLAGMRAICERNKSVFIRSAVANFVKEIDKRKGGEV